MQLFNGDCLDILATLPDNSVDSIVTDPPYGLSFRGKQWDKDTPGADIFAQCLRVLKPGGHMLAFGGSRTYHRMAVAVEDAGFQIRDMMVWCHASGFPKSHNVSKAINKLAGGDTTGYESRDITAPATDAAKQWDGWGTTLKPALEPIVLARKPLQGAVAKNVLEWGTGAMNIDGCRVEGEPIPISVSVTNRDRYRSSYDLGISYSTGEYNSKGRFPTNFIHDGSDEVVGLFPESRPKNWQAGVYDGSDEVLGLFPESKSGNGKATTYEKKGGQWGKDKQIRNTNFGDSDSAARFFKSCPYEEGEGASFAYFPKASNKDRNEGLEGFEEKFRAGLAGADRDTETKLDDVSERFRTKPVANNHPTLKSTDLMRYLVRLVTPPGGTVLDPFMGSGSTGKACVYEGFDFIGIELDPEYVEIARARIKAAQDKHMPRLFAAAD